MAIEVMAAAAGGAENRRNPAHYVALPLQTGKGHLVLVVGDGVPDHEEAPRIPTALEEDTAVAGVERAAEAEVGVRQADGDGRGGHEAG